MLSLPAMPPIIDFDPALIFLNIDRVRLMASGARQSDSGRLRAWASRDRPSPKRRLSKNSAGCRRFLASLGKSTECRSGGGAQRGGGQNRTKRSPWKTASDPLSSTRSPPPPQAHLSQLLPELFQGSILGSSCSSLRFAFPPFDPQKKHMEFGSAGNCRRFRNPAGTRFCRKPQLASGRLGPPLLSGRNEGL